MEKYIIKRAGEKDLSYIKTLQESNLFRNVSEADRKKEGFVSVETSILDLKKISKDIGILIVTSNSEIVGYELPLSLEYAEKIPLLVPFIERILNLKYKGKKLLKYKIIIEGQICVDRKHKGKGIAEKLHKEFIKLLKPKYDLIITEVSDQNPLSLHVHTEKLGFSILEQYSVKGRNWYVLMQDIKKK